MRSLLVAALVACSAPPRQVPATPTVPEKFVVTRTSPAMADPRLPHTFEPSAYRAHLAIRGNELSATIAIDATLAAPSDAIWLDASGLVILRARARGDHWSVPLEARTSPDDRIVLLAATPLPAGTLVIEIDYTARIRDVGVVDAHRQATYWTEQVDGAFRESFEGHSYVFTQFEPFYARSVFPCIDEPDRRTPWTLTLDVPLGETAASNTPIAAETPLDATTKRVRFATTAPLPSYLVAFAVGPFDIVETKSSANGAPIRLLAQHGHGAASKAAADQLAPILDALDAWTGIPYAFGKLDVVLVPLTGQGWFAMENPGLITVGEAGIRGGAGIEWSSIMTHEIAHQWFGNLVTIAWWNDIWLNESLTVWLASKIERELKHTREDWVESARTALALFDPVPDVPYAIGPQTRPPLWKSYRFKDLAPYFGGQRGAAFLDALEAFIGESTFRERVQMYLRANGLQSVTTSELAVVLQRFDMTQPPLTSAIDSGIDNTSAPTLAVDVQCSPTKATVHVAVSPTWTVPMCIRYDVAGTPTHRCALVRDNADIDLGATCPSWISPNATGAGFYRSAWTPAMVENIARHGWSQLLPRERARMVVELEAADLQTLPAAIALAATNANDAIARTWIARSIAAHWHHVPDDLRPTLVAKLEPLLERVRDMDIASDAPSPDEQAARAAELELAATVGDPAMVARGNALLRDLSKVPFPSMPWVRLLAARADPSIIPELLASSINDNAVVLSRMPTIAKLVPSRDAYAPSLYVRLLSRACSSADRTDALANTTEPLTSALAKQIDACIAERAALDPLFRGWLGRPRGVGRRR